MIFDHYDDKWRNPPYRPWKTSPWPDTYPPPPPVVYPLPPKMPTQEEIDEFRKLLKRAREYDQKNHEPDCENEEKKRKLKDLAKELGVKIDFVDEE